MKLHILENEIGSIKSFRLEGMDSGVITKSWNNPSSSSVDATERLRGGQVEFRTVLHGSGLASIVNSSLAGHSEMPAGYEPCFQLVLPYFGLFAYAVGKSKWLVDSTKVLFISPGWEFRDEQPVPGLGHASILINPASSLVDEICGVSGSRWHFGFPQGTLQSSPQLQLLAQWPLVTGESSACPLQADEWVVRVMQRATMSQAVRDRPSAKTVARAKEFLHAHDCERVSLDRVAQAVGVSPVYLTQEFTRAEGMPLYQYQLALRLSRALLELPHCGDITGLALDLGFSSHSHFTSIFRRAFGKTPSEYRRTAQSPQILAAALQLFQSDGGVPRRAA